MDTEEEDEDGDDEDQAFQKPFPFGFIDQALPIYLIPHCTLP